MFLEKLKCSNCDKEIDKNENITIHTNSKNLNGITNLKSWAKIKKYYMKNAQNKKEPMFRLFFISTSNTLISISLSLFNY